MTDPLSDLLVVGGGVIGLNIAERAVRRGLRVTLLERERLGTRASWAGAGMLNSRPWPKPPEGDPDYHDLVIASIRLHATDAARLHAETGIDPGFVRCGALELLTPERAAPAAQTNIARLLEGCAARDVRATYLSPHETQDLEPGLNGSGLIGALHFPDDAQIRSPRYVRALIVSCKQRGVHIREGTDVADVWVEQARACGVVLKDGTHVAANNVVISSGAWAARLPKLTKAVPRTAKIEPVRGQIVCFQARPALVTRLLTAEQRYLVPRPDGVILVGSTMERVGYEVATTPEAQADLRAFAEALLPELKGVEPLKGWADLRPGLKGRHPLAGPVPSVAGLYIAAGHYRSGITLAPITAEALVALLCGEKCPVDFGPWMPES